MVANGKFQSLSHNEKKNDMKRVEDWSIEEKKKEK